MKNIHKKFPGVYALKNVDFDLKSGEVHALLGENGAGKSTLIKVLGGIYRAEEGKIVIQGKETLINSVADARETGISIIHQEIMLVPNMTIAKNIFMGREPTTRSGGVNYRRMNTEAQALIDGFGINIDASLAASCHRSAWGGSSPWSMPVPNTARAAAGGKGQSGLLTTCSGRTAAESAVQVV